MSNSLIVRRVSDANFEHCASILLPFCVESIRHLRPGDRINQDTLNAIHIAAEVAQAFAAERYGKPRYRVAAIMRVRP